jgi:uncharacterized phage-associated protein
MRPVKGKPLIPLKTPFTTTDTIADYILWMCHRVGDLPTNWKLQKLVYYAHAWYIALYDRPLVDGEFQAWVHGPVHPALYSRFRGCGWDRINYQPPKKPILPPGVEKHINEVMDIYNKFTAWDLARMSHEETPWREARGNIPESAPSKVAIRYDSIKKYYSALIKQDV